MTSETQVYRASLRATVVAIVALAIAAVVVGLIVAGVNGVVAALVGVGVAALSGLTTQAAMLMGHRKSSESLAMLVLGSWAVKMLVIIVALLLLQGIEDFHRPLFASFAFAGIIATLVIDVWILRKSRVPYVQPGSNKHAE